MGSIFSCTQDRNIVQPEIAGQITFRSGSFLTISQLSSYADMDVVNAYAGILEYGWNNLPSDTSNIIVAGTESAVLFRTNAWLRQNELDEWEELPELFYLGDYTQIPGITQAEISIIEDIDAIILNHYTDSDGWYDDFKSYIENVNIGNLSAGTQQEVATTLYMLDISFHYTEVLGMCWWGFHPTPAQTRCMLATISGAGIGFILSGFNPAVGVLSGMAAYSGTDACW